jgi:hypothetical protein
MPTLAEQIRTCGEKTDQAAEIQRNNRVAIRADWNYIQVLAVSLDSQLQFMFTRNRDCSQNEQVLLCKFLQYPGLIRELLETDDAEIVNVSTVVSLLC